MPVRQGAPELWDYAAFVDGQELAVLTICLDDNRVRLWEDVFARTADPKALPSSLLVCVMMEAYLRSAQPRPHGNIHAAQKLKLSGIHPKRGDALTVTTAVARKYERKGRKWIAFQSKIESGDGVLLHGEILSIWAS